LASFASLLYLVHAIIIAENGLCVNRFLGYFGRKVPANLLILQGKNVVL